MAKKSRRAEQNSSLKMYTNINERVTGFFTLVLLVVFPLIYHNYYFDILQTKYSFFYKTVFLLAISLLILAIIWLIFEVNVYEGVAVRTFFMRFHPRNWKRTFTIPDVAMFSFLLIAIISTVQSDYVYESFWGNEGRYTGLFLLLVYGLGFFIISKCLNFKGWYMDAFLVSGLLVCLFGITDYFNMDILGFKENIELQQHKIFTSTLGNINTYTAYVALVMGVATVLFAKAKGFVRIAAYYGGMVICFCAIIMGQSDNAYLALLALFAFLPLYLFRDRAGVKRYLVIVASFFSIIQVVDIINSEFAERVIGLDGLFKVLTGYDKLAIVVLGAWTMVVVVFIVDYILKNKVFGFEKRLWIIWLLGLLVVASLGIYIMYDVNVAGNLDRYGDLENYLVINDDWGTHRWYIWRIGIENYLDFSFVKKLFGCGPDTFGIITTMNNYKEMTQRYGEVFDSAHNEYLQYFITIGFLGLLAYLSLLVSSAIRMVRKAFDKPEVMAVLFAIICYGAQAFVNINLPIATPVMWTLLMVGLAGCRD